VSGVAGKSFGVFWFVRGVAILGIVITEVWSYPGRGMIQIPAVTPAGNGGSISRTSTSMPAAAGRYLPSILSTLGVGSVAAVTVGPVVSTTAMAACTAIRDTGEGENVDTWHLAAVYLRYAKFVDEPMECVPGWANKYNIVIGGGV
jgi:hypothetical protein